jgi:hypothetical protein
MHNIKYKLKCIFKREVGGLECSGACLGLKHNVNWLASSLGRDQQSCLSFGLSYHYTIFWLASTPHPSLLCVIHLTYLDDMQ